MLELEKYLKATIEYLKASGHDDVAELALRATIQTGDVDPPGLFHILTGLSYWGVFLNFSTADFLSLEENKEQKKLLISTLEKIIESYHEGRASTVVIKTRIKI